MVTVEQQIIAMRAIRAALGLEQKHIAAFSGISERTYIDAEKGRRCTNDTWGALEAYYASQGWRVASLNGSLVLYQVCK